MSEDDQLRQKMSDPNFDPSTVPRHQKWAYTLFKKEFKDYREMFGEDFLYKKDEREYTKFEN